jgi:hypothetical protein
MKEYKLLQWYPGLPKNWEEEMLVGKGDRYSRYSPCNGKYTDAYLDDVIVENNPTFWELQVEKSYEVTKTYHIHGKGVKISGVKRVSDNVEFSIGDYFEKDKQIVGIIEKGTYRAWLQYDLDRPDYGVCLSVAEKLEPLFMSEEGLPVFKGGTVWVPQIGENKYAGVFEFHAEHVSNSIKSKYFAKKENAEKFIEYINKTYTLSEVKRIVNNWAMCGIDEEDIIKFVNK